MREIRFLEEVELSILSQRRKSGPYGMSGGGDGKAGIQRILRADGGTEILEAVSSTLMKPGDRLVLESPGGGAWGAREEEAGEAGEEEAGESG